VSEEIYTPKAVVSGSFHRAGAGLEDILWELSAAGVRVLSPISSVWVKEVDGFVMSADQVDLLPLDVELAHLGAITQSDFVWLHAPGGYVGLSGAMEIGYAYKAGIRVYASEELEDRALGAFVEVVGGIEDAISETRRRHRLSEMVAKHVVVYDELATSYDERSAALVSVTEEVVDVFVKYLDRGSSVLDVGCGSGTALRLLAAAGYDSEGVDASSNMAELAATRSGRRVVTGDILEVPMGRRYDGVLALAFIHLFPKNETVYVLDRLRGLLVDDGLLYIGSTVSDAPREGLERKSDYVGGGVRWRSHFTKAELKSALVESGFVILEEFVVVDAFNKTWFDVVARKREPRLL
jgi:SAM-dependent methyltransferase